MERVTISPQIAMTPAPVTVNWIYAFGYGGAFKAQKGPVPGQCVNLDDNVTLPLHTIGASAGAYIDWGPNITVEGPGLAGGRVMVPKRDMAQAPFRDNRPNPLRIHNSPIYGGPGWQETGLAGSEFVSEGAYKLTIGAKTIDFTMANSYTLAAGNQVGGPNPVPVPRTGDWTPTWETKPNPEGAEHTAAHHFVFVAFARLPTPQESGPKGLYVCVTDDKGDGINVTIPASIIATLPDAGIVQSGNLTHWMDKLDNGRRFDVFTIWCNISLYTKM